MCLEIIWLIYMYKKDLQWLICHQTILKVLISSKFFIILFLSTTDYKFQLMQGLMSKIFMFLIIYQLLIVYIIIYTRAICLDLLKILKSTSMLDSLVLHWLWYISGSVKRNKIILVNNCKKIMFHALKDLCFYFSLYLHKVGFVSSKLMAETWYNVTSNSCHIITVTFRLIF